jgi:hypothetical protein
MTTTIFSADDGEYHYDFDLRSNASYDYLLIEVRRRNRPYDAGSAFIHDGEIDWAQADPVYVPEYIKRKVERVFALKAFW